MLLNLIKNKPHLLATAMSVLLLLGVGIQHAFSNNMEQVEQSSAVPTSDDISGLNKMTNPSPKLNAQRLASLNMFGKEIVKAKAAPIKAKELTTKTDPKNLPKSKVKLDIKGLFSNHDENKGHAVITDTTGADRSFRVGQEIQQGITLHSIHQDYAVIKNQNRLERLELPEMKLSGTGNRFASQQGFGSRQKRLADAKKRNQAPKERIQ